MIWSYKCYCCHFQNIHILEAYFYSLELKTKDTMNTLNKYDYIFMFNFICPSRLSIILK